MPRLAPAQRAALGVERREQILAAAVRLWTGHGFEATTLDAIAREAGIAKGTVYLYFATKEELLAAAVERFSLLPDVAAFGAELADLPVREAVPRLAELLWSRLRGSAPLVGLLLRELVLRPAEARTFVQSVVLPVNGAFAAWLEGRVRAGEIRAVDTFVAGARLHRHADDLRLDPARAGRRGRPPDRRARRGRDRERPLPPRHPRAGRGSPARRAQPLSRKGPPPDSPEARPVIEFFVLMIVWGFVMLRWITGGKGYE